MIARKPNSRLRHAGAAGLTKHALGRFVAGLAVVALAAIACRQNEPLEPKTPPNSPLPKIDKPEEPMPAPTPRLPKPDQDGG